MPFSGQDNRGKSISFGVGGAQETTKRSHCGHLNVKYGKQQELEMDTLRVIGGFSVPTFSSFPVLLLRADGFCEHWE